MSIVGFQNLYQGDGGTGCPSITLGDGWDLSVYSGQVFSPTVQTVSGTDGPHAIQVLSGSIPDGLTIDTETYEQSPGVWIFEMYGTLGAIGTYTFTVGGTDVNGCAITPKQYIIEVGYEDMGDFIDRVQAAGSDVTGSLLTSYNNLVTDSLSIRSNALRLNMLAADGFAGIFEPVFLGPDVSTPLGGASDTNNNIVSGNYGLGTGVLGNGSTMFIQTGFIPSAVAQWGLNDACFCFGKVGGSAGSRCVMAAADGGFTKKAMLFDSWGGGAPLVAMNTSSNDTFGAAQLADGNYYVVRTQNGDYDIYIDGVYDSTIARAADVEPDDEFLLFEAAMAGYKYNGTITWYGIFTGMSAGEVATLNTAVNNFLTSIGR